MKSILYKRCYYFYFILYFSYFKHILFKYLKNNLKNIHPRLISYIGRLGQIFDIMIFFKCKKTKNNKFFHKQFRATPIKVNIVAFLSFDKQSASQIQCTINMPSSLKSLDLYASFFTFSEFFLSVTTKWKTGPNIFHYIITESLSQYTQAFILS